MIKIKINIITNKNFNNNNNNNSKVLINNNFKMQINKNYYLIFKIMNLFKNIKKNFSNKITLLAKYNNNQAYHIIIFLQYLIKRFFKFFEI